MRFLHTSGKQHQIRRHKLFGRQQYQFGIELAKAWLANNVQLRPPLGIPSTGVIARVSSTKHATR